MNLHPRVGWVQRRCYGRAEPTPRQSGSVLLDGTAFLGGGRPTVWAQHRWLPACDGGAAVVHRGIYLAPDDTSTIESVLAALKERPRGAELLVAGDFNVKLSEPEGKLHPGGTGDRGTRGYVGALPPAPALMVPGREVM